MTVNNFLILTINAIAHAIGYSTLLYNLCGLFTKKRVSYITMIMVMFVSALMISFVSEAYILIALFLASGFFLVYRKIPKLQVIICCISAVGICFVNLLTINLLYQVLHLPMERVPVFRENVSYNIAISVIYIVIELIYSMIIRLISHKTYRIDHNDNSNIWGSFIYVIVFGVLFLMGVTAVFCMFTIVEGMDSIRDYLLSCDIFILLQIIISIFVGTFVLFSSLVIYSSYKFTKQKTKEIEMEKDKEITELYKQEIQNMYDEISDFKHDYMKIYSSMSMLIATGNIKELKEYFSDEIMPLQDKILSETSMTHNLTLIDDSIVKGLVYTYVLKSRKNSTNFYVAINERIPANDSISSLDLSRILGILLDNAFEEIGGDEKGLVQFGIYNNKNRIVYTVKNTYKRSTGIKNGLNTNQSDKGEGRGRGLKILKTICDRYGNVLYNIDYNQSYFTAEIIVDKINTSL